MMKASLSNKVTLVMLAALGAACSGEGPEADVTTQALTAPDVDRVLGFEATTVSDWAIVQNGPGTLSVSTTVSQGSHSLAVTSHGYVPVQSVALSSLGSRVGSVIRYDIMLPAELKQISPGKYGATQLYLNSPSAGLNNVYIGQAELSPLPLGQWNTISFTPTAAVLTKLRGTYTDLRVTIVVNAPYNATKPYLLDNLRFSDKTLALISVSDGSNHALSGITVVAYSGSTPTSNTGVSDSTGVAKISLPAGSYRFAVTEAGVTTYSGPTNQCLVPGTCPAATIILKCHGVVCSAKDICHTAGTCDPGTGVCSNPAKPNCTLCGGGQLDCDGNPANGCETNVNSDIDHCGGCATVCSSTNNTPTCVAGQCVVNQCNVGYGNCNGSAIDGCEINLMTNPAHCGACGTVCSANNGTPSCVNGQCVASTCNAGFADCNGLSLDGCEINTTNNPLNCGGCGNICSPNNATPSCTAGQCIENCHAGFADCNGWAVDGCEISISNNAFNCGGCGIVCSANNGTPSCVAGQCVASTCNAGFADCNGSGLDGCEINTTNNPLNCGSCGNICSPNNATPSCVASQCIESCNAGFADCNSGAVDGCEVNIMNDLFNCGGCGNVCSPNNATSSCTAGQCIETCHAGFADCNGSGLDGCEINILNDRSNCGGCGQACTGGQTCVSAVCQ